MKIRPTLKVLTASLLLASCAQTPTQQGALNIQPFEEVRHSYDQARAQYALGRYYHGQLRYEQAIEAYRRALALNPDMVDAMNAMGVAYAESGRFVLARQQFEAALKRAPDSAYTYNNLGFVNYLAGDYAAAVRAYRASLRLDASQEKARQNLVLASSRMGEGTQIAHAGIPVAPVAPHPTAPAIAQTKSPQDAWVKVSPQIYELRPDVAATLTTRSADAAAERSARSVMPRATAANASVPATETSGARSTEAGSSLRLAAFEAPSVEAPHGQTPVASLRGVEVSNGNGIRGLAARVADYFYGKGVPHARLTNQHPFAERHTRIEYRPGSVAEAARINSLLPRTVPVVASRKLRSDIRVRLVLGHDIERGVVAWSPSPNAIKVAEASAAAGGL